MRLHFYKLHIGGNAFILAHQEAFRDTSGDTYKDASKKLCDRRYGIGASGCIFLGQNNTIRIYTSDGKETANAPDAFLCAARYAFDSGRICKTSAGETELVFKTISGEQRLSVISSREFALDLGSPFSLISGKLISQEFSDCIETFSIDEKPICVSGVHIVSDFLVAQPSHDFSISLLEFYIKLRKNFHGRQVYPVFARTITQETISLRTMKRGIGTSSAGAAAALVASSLTGSCGSAAICIFEKGNPSLYNQEIHLADDTDNSRKIAAVWNTDKNEIQVIGTGGYLFEGDFEL